MKQENLTPAGILKMFIDFAETSKSEYIYNLEAMKNEERISRYFIRKYCLKKHLFCEFLR